MSKFHKLKSGTQLPLMNLKGKDYLQVVHRLVWLVEETPHYTIETEFLKLEDTFSVAKAVVKIFEGGVVVKQATATKRETQKDFPDFIEKSETGAIGRALAMLGFGTAFTEPDMDEGMRLADSPVPPPTKATAEVKQEEVPKKVKSFKTGTTTKPETSDWE